MLEYKPYRRPFAQPLQTAHRTWSVREGIVLRLERADGSVGYGEVAPVPWFGTETLEQSVTFLKELQADPTIPVPKGLPCTQFAWDCAQGALDEAPLTSLPVAKLLPAGKDAIAQLPHALAEGYTTFKWKIGVDFVQAEQRIATELFRHLHEHGVLRLDANGALSREETESWLHFLRDYPVDYLEQPMAISQEDIMAKLSHQSPVTIALDESIASHQLLALLAEEFTRGAFVVKPAIMGSIEVYRQWRRAHLKHRIIYSSVFETAIGTDAAIRLAALDEYSADAIGFDTSVAADGLSYPGIARTATSGRLTPHEKEALWNRL
ncbi:MAG: o-succinylbenzoate synthase [Verrucomicrobiota bacterium]